MAVTFPIITVLLLLIHANQLITANYYAIHTIIMTFMGQSSRKVGSHYEMDWSASCIYLHLQNNVKIVYSTHVDKLY